MAAKTVKPCRDLRNFDKKVARNDVLKDVKDLIGKNYLTRLVVIADVIDRYIDVSLRNEVNWVRFRALLSLVRFGEGSMTLKELSTELMRPMENISELIKSLERDGLVVKRRSKKDQRSVIVRITNGGLNYVRESLEKMAHAETKLKECLDGIELEAITTMVRKIRRYFIQPIGNLSDVRSTDKATDVLHPD